MAGEPLTYNSGSFLSSVTWETGDRVNWWNNDYLERWAVGQPFAMVGKSYYSAIFGDAYVMIMDAYYYPYEPSHFDGAQQTLYVADNDTTEKVLLYPAAQAIDACSWRGVWDNWGGDTTVSYTYVAMSSGSYKSIGAESVGRKLRILSNPGAGGTYWILPSFAENTLMTTAHFICSSTL